MSGRVRVPGDLPDGARWALRDHVEGIFDDFYDDYPADRRALRRLRPLRRYQSGFVAVDGEELSRVRNLADTDTLGLEPECGTTAGVTLGDGSLCGQCHWCQAHVLRDRIDFWMDAAGKPKSAYIGDVDYDVEAAWAKVWRGEIIDAA